MTVKNSQSGGARAKADLVDARENGGKELEAVRQFAAKEAKE